MLLAARNLAAVVGLLALAVPAGTPAGAQDSMAVRRPLPVDLARVAPFQRSYDIVVHGRDSSTIIGVRQLSLAMAPAGGAAGWVLAERRSGAVPAAETLFVAPDLRPLQWSSWLGSARLAAVFLGDTIMGAATAGGTKQNLLIHGRPDLLVSGAMVELVIGLLPLADQWRDSAAVLAVTPAGQAVIPAELLMLGNEDIYVDSTTVRRTHVVALRTDARSALYWVDVGTGAVLRMQQVVPPHVGLLLEYRLRPDSLSGWP